MLGVALQSGALSESGLKGNCRMAMQDAICCQLAASVCTNVDHEHCWLAWRAPHDLPEERLRWLHSQTIQLNSECSR